MILEDAMEFLKGVPPFQFLGDDLLKKTARELSLEYYPAGTVVLQQNGPPSDCLRIIKKGTIQVLMDAEEEDGVLMEVKGEGDNFGFLSMIGKDRQRTTVKVVEDSLCYILNRDRVLWLLEVSPPFSEYFMAYLSRYVDRTYREMHHRGSFYGSSDRLLFTTRVGDIAIPLITITENATIQEAAEAMVRHKINSLVLIKQGGLPSGIVTDRDFREKVVAKGRNVLEPVKNIGTLALIRVDGRDTCFEALLKMIQYTIHHLLVVDEGEVRGIVTNHDLMLLQGTSPVSFAKDIISQQSIEGLVPLASKIFNIVGLLLREETPYPQLANIIGEIRDRLFRKIIDIGEQRFGPPPLPYCLVAIGSEGRRELVFSANRNFVVVYSDPSGEEARLAASQYFSQFQVFFEESLVAFGAPSLLKRTALPDFLPYNAARDWEAAYRSWLTEPERFGHQRILPFFDARPVYGKAMLFHSLRDRILPLVGAGDHRFLCETAKLACAQPTPVGFIKNLVAERDGSQQERLDLYRRGLQPMINLIRYFALRHGLRESTTLGRIRYLRDHHPQFTSLADELTQAFEFMMLMHIHQQYQLSRKGQSTETGFDPGQLSSLEKKTLREAFRLVWQLQTLALLSIREETQHG